MAPMRRKVLLVAVWTANVLIALYAKTGALWSVAKLLGKLLLSRSSSAHVNFVEHRLLDPSGQQ